ncbi:MAG: CvpA family protein [Oscillospiraceae bacterium]
MDPINVNFTGSEGKREKAAYTAFVPVKNAWKKITLNVVLTLVIAAVAYYFMLPALNFKSMELYFFVGIMCAVYFGLTILTSKAFVNPEYIPYVKKQAIAPAIIVGLLVVVGVIGTLAGSTIIRANSYSKLLNVQEGDFAKDVAEINFSSVPILDSFSSNKIAERTLGDLSDKVSQFIVSPNSTQINYKGVPTRVTALDYGDIFKWVKNTKDGIPAYITVDMTTQEGNIVRLEQGMKYSPSEHFGRYLMRYLRFKYPTYMFETPSFEINEEGTPFWIVPIMDKTIGLFGGIDIIGAVAVDAITGETNVISTNLEGKTKLNTTQFVTDKNWQWIDRIYSADILNAQYNYYGQLSGGFINSIIGQEGVKVTSQGYNYLALNDDVYMYTGVTSISSDQSIIGFVLLNQRTKETRFYQISGALEGTAQTSAQGAVQQYKYEATFPLLLNISGEPTYFISLKDTSQLVKMFAMVNVKQSTIVGIGTNLTECTEKYAAELKRNGINVDINIDDLGEEKLPGVNNVPTIDVTGAITEIRSAVIGGESCYYIKLSGNAPFFKVKASMAEKVIILNVGDTITISVDGEIKGDIMEAKAIK